MYIIQLVLQYIVDDIMDALRSSYSDLHKSVHGCRFVPTYLGYEQLKAAYERLQVECREEIARLGQDLAEDPFDRDDRLTAEAMASALTPTPDVTIGAIMDDGVVLYGSR